jgi:crotonobetainyl-CoA:carnitine CoA-transferase CaiB-like acyl-CoA transferase
MKAYDLLVQAETGLCSVTGNADGPSRVGVSVCDIACGMYAHAAILQALIGRQKTGKGRGIQVSLFSGMADWMNVVYLQRKYGGSVPPRLGLAHPTIAPYGVFHCRDGDLLLSIQNEREWKMLCEIALEGEVKFDDPLFHDVVARVANRTELERRMNSIFGREARAVIAERLKEASVAFGLLNDVDGLIAHPQLRTVTYATPEGEATVIAPAAAIVGETPTYRAVPATGQHSTALRKEFA